MVSLLMEIPESGGPSIDRGRDVKPSIWGARRRSVTISGSLVKLCKKGEETECYAILRTNGSCEKLLSSFVKFLVTGANGLARTQSSAKGREGVMRREK